MIHISFIDIVFLDKDSNFHRINGPSIIENKYVAWYKNGRPHRIGGPAVINHNNPYWYIEGIIYPESVYHVKIKEMGME